MSNRDHIRLHINGEDVAVRGPDAFLTLADYLRLRRRLTGTKIVCSEGDCGSCSVLCGKPRDGELEYHPIDSCIRFVFQLDSTQIITIEGLQQNGQLNAVQQALVDCHGSQCGFCTPGFVVAMTALKQRSQALTDDELRRGLTGNLCRCTGYSPIIQAGLRHSPAPFSLDMLDSPFRAMGNGQAEDAIEITAPVGGEPRTVFCPATIRQALEFLSRQPHAKIISGATDVGVQHNKGQLSVSVWLDLNRIDELSGVTIDGDCLVAGARATWTQIATVVESRVPQFHNIIDVFGAPQIRHVGTLGGNIVNASPIADSLPFLYVCDAELTIAGPSGERTIGIEEFYRSYKEVDLRSGELLTLIRVPLPPPHRPLRLYKVSRRRDLDIATLTGAIWMELDGGQIVDAGIAYGAVGPVVIRLRRTEQFLRGKPFSIETLTQAGEVAVAEISPISDVRGPADYRRQLAANVLKKFYYQVEQEPFQTTR